MNYYSFDDGVIDAIFAFAVGVGTYWIFFA